MDGELAGISLLILPLALADDLPFFGAGAAAVERAAAGGERCAGAGASEGLTSIRIVHAFGQEEYEVREFTREAQQSYAANLKLTVTNAVSLAGDLGGDGAGLSVVLYVAALHILDHRLTVGQLTLFLAYGRCFISRWSSSATRHGLLKERRRGCNACLRSGRGGFGAGARECEADAAGEGEDYV